MGRRTGFSVLLRVLQNYALGIFGPAAAHRTPLSCSVVARKRGGVMGVNERRLPGGPRHHIDLGDDEYVRLWCEGLGCTIAELAGAVEAIGQGNELVQDYLKRQRRG
jgi:hypothetical protein